MFILLFQRWCGLQDLWTLFRKLKLYEEQELTMQVFSEPEASPGTPQTNENNRGLERRDSYETANTYATIQPRNISQMVEIDDYASLRNTRPPSVSNRICFSWFVTHLIQTLHSVVRIPWLNIPGTTKRSIWLCNRTHLTTAPS